MVEASIVRSLKMTVLKNKLSEAGQMVLDQFRALPEAERKQLLGFFAEPQEIDLTEEEWVDAVVAESERRMARVRSGESQLIPGDVATKQLRNRPS
jgi:hypothetical protein